MTIAVEVAVRVDSLLGEGALWDDVAQRLYWVDIRKHKLQRYDPSTEKNEWFDIGQPVGTVVPRTSGGVMLAVQAGFASYDFDTQQLRLLATPTDHDPQRVRFNDGKCDPAGRFWAGTMAHDMAMGAAALYRFDTDLSLHQMLTGITISNGLAWSHDQRTLYYIDTIPGTVTAYAYDVDTGAITDGRVVISVPAALGYPDGMTIDSEGMLWIAHYDGGCVRRWNPHTAEILQTIELPAAQVTSCAFGGANLDQLYITTATQEMDEAEKKQTPLAGSLFVAQPGTQGVPAFRFAG